MQVTLKFYVEDEFGVYMGEVTYCVAFLTT